MHGRSFVKHAILSRYGLATQHHCAYGPDESGISAHKTKRSKSLHGASWVKHAVRTSYSSYRLPALPPPHPPTQPPKTTPKLWNICAPSESEFPREPTNIRWRLQGLRNKTTKTSNTAQNKNNNSQTTQQQSHNHQTTWSWCKCAAITSLLPSSGTII